jgi:VCBS repeat-containing protein
VTATPVHAYDVLGGTVAVAPAQAANGGVLADDSDTASGAVLNVSAVDGSTANVGVGVAGIFGVLTLDADGSYSYVNNNPGGVSVAGGVVEDSFNFTVSDGQGDTANSTLTVLIASPSNDYMTGPQGSTIEAGKGPTVLDGSAGDMNVYAGPGGHQWLVGGPGDTMVGASDRDAFVFTPSFGNETIENFHPRDVIEFPESLFANFTAVKADMESSGANTVITVDANDAITLTNFTPAQLHAHNFHFIV